MKQTLTITQQQLALARRSSGVRLVLLLAKLGRLQTVEEWARLRQRYGAPMKKVLRVMRRLEFFMASDAGGYPHWSESAWSLIERGRVITKQNGKKRPLVLTWRPQPEDTIVCADGWCDDVSVIARDQCRWCRVCYCRRHAAEHVCEQMPLHEIEQRIDGKPVFVQPWDEEQPDPWE